MTVQGSRRATTDVAPVSEDVREELRARLLADRKNLLERIAAEHGTDAFVLTATYGQGETELAVRDVEAGLAAALEHLAEEGLEAIDEALARLDSPEFGKCETCGTEIPTERLLAVPTATRCVPCQQRHEGRR